MGSSFLCVFHDTWYFGVIRGSHLKVLQYHKDLCLLETNHLLQSYLKDISLGAVDIDRHSLYASSNPGYSYTR